MKGGGNLIIGAAFYIDGGGGGAAAPPPPPPNAMIIVDPPLPAIVMYIMIWSLVKASTHGENCWKLLHVEPFHGFVVSDYIALFCVNR